MLHLVRADDPNEAACRIRAEKTSPLPWTVVVVENINSMKLMSFIAGKLVSDLKRQVIMICKTKEGWSDFRKLAEECGHLSEDWTEVDPTLN